MATEINRERKLAVILHADVVGSTALVRLDETTAHARITDAFAQFSETVTAYGGSVQEVRGDALVAEFARASDAIASALAAQAANKTTNAALDDDLRPEIRVGIALGEVVIADETVTGPGIVLAQLEQLAEPGGICIQGAVQEATPDRMPFRYTSLGERAIKGFEEPVRAFSVTVQQGAEIPVPDIRPDIDKHERRSMRRWIAAAPVVMALIAAGLAAWLQPWKLKFEAASVDQMAFPLPAQPSIAVFPFNARPIPS